MILLALACGKQLTEDELKDPQSCAECHPAHVEQWTGSMHAYAAEDPVFLAMNARGQEETDGELGDFCVQCHAPLAVMSGSTTDGLNLDEVPDDEKGVTCYFCHLVEDVEGDHNNPLVLATDGVLRGGIANPFETTAHESMGSGLHNRNNPESARTCGACHDIVTPAGVHLERTFAEWKDSQYNTEFSGLLQSCGSCHMQGYDGKASTVEGSPERRVHDHSMVGVDIALTDFPNIDEQTAAVQKALDTTLLASIDVLDTGSSALVELTLENTAAGHAFPSGATQDRRAWVEVTAYKDDQVVFFDDSWWFGEKMYDAEGVEVHMFWEAVSTEGNLLYPPTSLTDDSNHQVNSYVLDEVPDRVEAVVKIRPMHAEVLEDLVASGHLDPSIPEKMPTFELAASRVSWSVDGE